MRGLIFLFTCFLLFSSCKRSKTCDEPKPDCSAIQCIAFWSYFDFRLIDRTNGEDLVFGTNPRYSDNDIKLFSDQARTISLYFTVDKIKKTLQTMTAKEEMYLEIKGTDVYKLTTAFKAYDCCSNRVKALWQDGKMICSCCTDIIPILIK
jgi:hypothetical protein